MRRGVYMLVVKRFTEPPVMVSEVMFPGKRKIVLRLAVDPDIDVGGGIP